MKLKHKINYKGLQTFLKTLTRDDIETNWRKPINPKLIEGTAMDDIDFFKMDISKIDEDKIIYYGEPFLVDAIR